MERIYWKALLVESMQLYVERGSLFACETSSWTDVVKVKVIWGDFSHQRQHFTTSPGESKVRGRIKGGSWWERGFGKSKSPWEEPPQRNHKHKVVLMVSWLKNRPGAAFTNTNSLMVKEEGWVTQCGWRETSWSFHFPLFFYFLEFIF